MNVTFDKDAVITDEELLHCVLGAAREVVAEDPRIGIDNSDEVPTAGRLAIRLARMPKIMELEKRGLFVDVEYSEGGSRADTGKKVPYMGRCDLMLHRRGSVEENLLACEIKMGERKAQVNKRDEERLKEMTGPTLRFQLGVWLRLPKTPVSKNCRWFAVYKGGKKLRDLQQF